MVFPELYYNASAYGQGLEGVMNYTNSLVDGWLVNLFLFFIFIASVVTLSKSEWATPGIVSFSFLICLISEFIFSLFTAVNPIVIFITIIGLGLSVAWGIIEKHS
ncbi:MAG TPA: hypothetical protein VMQ58_00980 [Candidatus Saccharimonadales bacterium]|nr:hypothetical protein [Candidatus Saccharimonadales bacterium]